jgi:CBS domain-containing protein
MATLAEVMRTDFITVAPEDTLGETAQKLVDAKTGAAVVSDFGRLIGIISERDLLKAMAGRVHTSDARVREWMTEDPIVASPDLEVEEAAQIMLDNNFRHLPVVEGDRVVGVASLRRLVGATQLATSD